MKFTSKIICVLDDWTIRIIFSVVLAFSVTPAAAQLTFTEIAASAGVTTPVDSNGSSVVDVDGDGLEDLLVTGSLNGISAMVLYRNNGDRTFTDVTSAWPGLRPASPAQAVSWADFDNDGDPDVVMQVNTPTGSELRFLRNNRIGTGQQSFTVIQTLGPPLGSATLVAWGDFDNDGDLDAFVGINPGTAVLLRNNLKESGTTFFVDVTATVGLLTADGATNSAHWIDADNDGDLDLFVVNNFNSPVTVTRDLFYRNLLKETGNATFQEVTGAVGFHTASVPSTNAIFGDYDNDGDQDLYVGLGHFTPNLLYRNNLIEGGSLSFTELGGTLGVQQPIDGGISLWGDLDNDGDLDLLAGDPSNQPWVLYRNELVETGSPGFTDITSAAGLPHAPQSALLFFDMDNDGDLDIFAGFNGNGSSRLFRNDSLLAGRTWLALKLVGTASNRDGIGARMALLAGGRQQHRQHTIFASGRAANQSHRVHFGLGGAATVDQLTIHWPSGCVQTLRDVASNQVLTVVETCALDTVAPTTTANAAPAPNAAGWNNSNVTVTLSATDNAGGSGVQSISFTVSNGSSTTGSSATGASTTFTVSAEGVNTISYHAVDNAGNVEATKTLVVRIDKTPPSANLTVSPSVLWPPNHKLVSVTPTLNASDPGGGPVTVSGPVVTSSEPVTGRGDKTSPDWVVNGNLVQLRAERNTRGPSRTTGRVYTLTYVVTDQAGNSTTASATVTVPHNLKHDKRKGRDRDDDHDDDDD